MIFFMWYWHANMTLHCGSRGGIGDIMHMFCHSFGHLTHLELPGHHVMLSMWSVRMPLVELQNPEGRSNSVPETYLLLFAT